MIETDLPQYLFRFFYRKSQVCDLEIRTLDGRGLQSYDNSKQSLLFFGR